GKPLGSFSRVMDTRPSCSWVVGISRKTTFKVAVTCIGHSPSGSCILLLASSTHEGTRHTALPGLGLHQCRQGGLTRVVLVLIHPDQIIRTDPQGLRQLLHGLGMQRLLDLILQPRDQGLIELGLPGQLILTPAPLLPQPANPLPHVHHSPPPRFYT